MCTVRCEAARPGSCGISGHTVQRGVCLRKLTKIQEAVCFNQGLLSFIDLSNTWKLWQSSSSARWPLAVNCVSLSG